MKRWWVSWYQSQTPFTLHSPWWISGYRMVADRLAFDEEREQAAICAAVIAPTKEAAVDLIIAAHDTPPRDLEWRFFKENTDDWSPFCDRFPKGEWMQWPEPVQR